MKQVKVGKSEQGYQGAIAFPVYAVVQVTEERARGFRPASPADEWRDVVGFGVLRAAYVKADGAFDLNDLILAGYPTEEGAAEDVRNGLAVECDGEATLEVFEALRQMQAVDFPRPRAGAAS